MFKEIQQGAKSILYKLSVRVGITLLICQVSGEPLPYVGSRKQKATGVGGFSLNGMNQRGLLNILFITELALEQDRREVTLCR